MTLTRSKKLWSCQGTLTLILATFANATAAFSDEISRRHELPHQRTVLIGGPRRGRKVGLSPPLHPAVKFSSSRVNAGRRGSDMRSAWQRSTYDPKVESRKARGRLSISWLDSFIRACNLSPVELCDEKVKCQHSHQQRQLINGFIDSMNLQSSNEHSVWRSLPAIAANHTIPSLGGVLALIGCVIQMFWNGGITGITVVSS